MLTAGGVRILCHVAAIQKGAKYDKYRIPIGIYSLYRKEIILISLDRSRLQLSYLQHYSLLISSTHVAEREPQRRTKKDLVI